MDEPRIKGDKSSEMERFVIDGNEAIEFKMGKARHFFQEAYLRSVADLENKDLAFRPEMCHQVFNEGETIFGYENLDIKVYFAAGSLKTYMGINYKRKITKALSDGIGPDDVVSKMENVLQGGYTSNFDDFSSCIEKEQQNFRPMGELVHSFSHNWSNNKESSKSTKEKKGKQTNGVNGASENGMAVAEKSFEIYMVDAVSTPKFVDYLKKMESFILFFIDAASFLDCSNDEKWRFFTLFEKYKTSEGNTAYAFYGYSSVYQFYTYPDLIRPRVAQMLILPPFQKQGLAIKLLSCVYSYYRSKPNVKEITVEDPSDDFELLRDYVDARDCQKLASYSKANLKKGFTPEMEKEAHEVLKMTKRQAQRIHEILRLQITNIHNDLEFKEFRLDVKRRLNIPYQKQESDIKRMVKRKLNHADLNKASALDDSTRKTELESNFQLLMTHYQNILSRLEKYGSS